MVLPRSVGTIPVMVTDDLVAYAVEHGDQVVADRAASVGAPMPGRGRACQKRLREWGEPGGACG